MYYTKYESEIVPMILVGDEAGLARLYFDVQEAKNKLEILDDWECNDSFFDDLKNQLNEYFQGNRKKFEVKLNPKGTAYQKKVWEMLKDIPYGETSTYKDIAQRIGSPKSARAVGGANGKNPIPLIVPCHRVVGADDSLTGYAFGLDLKKQLIELERKNS